MKSYYYFLSPKFEKLYGFIINIDCTITMPLLMRLSCITIERCIVVFDICNDEFRSLYQTIIGQVLHQ